MASVSTCPHCGRLDPWHLKPCYCQTTTMKSKEKDIILFYEHHTEGHPFGAKGCIACESESERMA